MQDLYIVGKNLFCEDSSKHESDMYSTFYWWQLNYILIPFVWL